MKIRALFFRSFFLLLIAVGAAAYLYHRASSESVGATITLEPAAFAQTVQIEGTVQAAQEVELGFEQGGRISGVYAQVGDQVVSGAKLAEIENGDLQAQVVQKEAALQAAQATLASLESGTRPETIAITQIQIASDGAAVAQAQQSVMNALQSAFTASDDAVHNKTDQIFLNPLNASISLGFTSTNSQLSASLMNERIAMGAMLSTWQASLASLSTTTLAASVSQTQSNLAQVAQFLSDANTVLNGSVPSQSVGAASLAAYTGAVSAARANINAAQSALTGAAASLQAAQALLSDDQKNLALQQAGSTADTLAAQQAVVAEAQADLQSAQAQLAQTVVTAPFDGEVTRMDVKVGQVIAPTSDEIAMISDGLFQAVCYIPEVEIAGVAPGESATTTLDAYGPSVFFPATVISVDPAETEVNGVATYKTTLQFSSKDPRIKSGMTAHASIAASSQAGALTVPLGSIYQKNGQQTVQIVQDGTVVDVPVVVSSASGIGTVQVISGLKAGDVVVLSPDTSR